jgi:hypothetical protein
MTAAEKCGAAPDDQGACPVQQATSGLYVVEKNPANQQN